jgi:hypothetical protein
MTATTPPRARRAAPGPPRPRTRPGKWTAELSRLRWLEVQIAALADELADRADELANRGVSSWSARERAAAAAMTQLSTRITETIAASHRFGTARDIDYAQFHLTELSGCLTAHIHAARDRADTA